MSKQKISLENLLTISDDHLSEDARLMRHYFMQIISELPNNVYWMSGDGKLLGGNQNTVQIVGAKVLNSVIGMNYDEMAVVGGWGELLTKSFKKDDHAVMSTGKPIVKKEEPVIYDEQGNAVYYLTTRIPLKDDNGVVQGIVGISTDITELKKREQELSIYKQIIENMSANIYWKNTEGVYLGGNQIEFDLAGENITGKTIHDLLDEQSASIVADNDRQVMMSNRPVEFEEDLNINGKKYTFLSRKSPIIDHDGQTIGMLGVSFDITERKKMEHELAVYADIMNNLPGPIYWKDKNSVYKKVNKFVLDILRLKEEEIIGKTDHDLWPEVAGDLVDHDQEVMRKRRSLKFEEKVIVNGQLKYFMASKMPLKDKDGNILGVVGNSLDITELKKREQELAVYAEIMNKLPGPIFWKDRSGVYRKVNKFLLELAGLKEEEVLGKTDYDLWPKFADAVVAHDQEVMKTHRVMQREENLVSSNGKDIFLDVVKVPMYDENKNIIGIIGNSLDITERKHLEEKQNEFAKAVLQVVHDIRAPLAVIDMLINEMNQLPEEQRVPMRHAIQRINDIAHHLINSYKGRAPECNVAQKIPVAVFLKRILAEKRLQFTKKNIEFKVDIEPRACFVFVLFESSALQRALSNLINNAVEASSDGASIELGLGVLENGKLELSITDHGVGMSDELLEKIGSYGSSHGKKNGAGLGLAHAKESLEKYQGQLKITSKIGEGSQVKIELPCVDAPAWFARGLILENNSVILIVDDDPSIHFLWRKKLEDVKKQLPGLSVHHFYQAKDLSAWFDKYHDVDAKEMVLLSDNELIGSEVNGQVIIETYRKKVAQAFLVTSHYAFHELAENLGRINAKLLPKELVMNLPIEIKAKGLLDATTEAKIDFVFLDDDMMLIQAYKFLAKSKGKNILLFSCPDELLGRLVGIPKETKFYIDSQLGEIRGEDFAKVLFDKGYKELYLATGAVDIHFNLANYPWLRGVGGKPEF